MVCELESRYDRLGVNQYIFSPVHAMTTTHFTDQQALGTFPLGTSRVRQQQAGLILPPIDNPLLALTPRGIRPNKKRLHTRLCFLPPSPTFTAHFIRMDDNVPPTTMTPGMYRAGLVAVESAERSLWRQQIEDCATCAACAVSICRCLEWIRDLVCVAVGLFVVAALGMRLEVEAVD